MPDYDVADFQGLPPSRRFQIGSSGPVSGVKYGDGRRDTIRRLRPRSSSSPVGELGSTPLECRVVFISHRQIDAARAHQVATIAHGPRAFRFGSTSKTLPLAGLAMSGATLTDDDVSR